MFDEGAKPILIPDDLLKAQKFLQARRKLSLVLSSKSVSDTPTYVGEIVEVFIKKNCEKRGKWTKSLPLLSYDSDTGMVSLPEKRGKTFSAAVEGVRSAIIINPLASAVR